MAISVADQVLMLQYSVYSVISPEGCASILWRTGERAAEAAEAMRVTAGDLKQLGVIDRIVPEPLGGAHRNREEAIGTLRGALREELDILAALSPRELRADRRAKFLAIG